MQDLHGVYAQLFNKRHSRSGHLFQGRYGSARIESDEHLLMVVAYIVRNPVEAGLCAAPQDWAWSSHRAMLRGDAIEPPRARYADLTEGYRRKS